MAALPIEALPLADCEMPEWCERYLSEGQAGNMLERTRWAILLDSMPTTSTGRPEDDYSASTHHVALRLLLYVSTNDDKAAWPSIPAFARATKLAENTVRLALVQLERWGWITRTGRTWSSGRQASNLYRLAWPAVDVIVQAGLGPARCWEPLTGKRAKPGTICTRLAGWGTSSDIGPCVLHGGIASRATPQPLQGDPATTAGVDPATTAITPATTAGECISSTSLQNASPLCGQRRAVVTASSAPNARDTEALTEERRSKELAFAQGLKREGRTDAEIATALKNARVAS